MEVSRPLETTISIQDNYGRREPGNLILEDCQFWGEKNFEGRYNEVTKKERRQFNVLIPNEHAQALRDLGWNCKTLDPRTEEEEPLSFMQVVVDILKSKEYPDDPEQEHGAEIWIKQGTELQKLNSTNVSLLDRTRAIETIDMEVRAWEFDRAKKPGEHSARLVTLVAVMRPNRLQEKYKNLT
jgi:hypothetical protein